MTLAGTGLGGRRMVRPGPRGDSTHVNSVFRIPTDPAREPLLVRSGAALQLFGALLTVVASVTAMAGDTSRLGLAALAVAAAVPALSMLRRPERVTRRLVATNVAFVNGLIALAIYLSGDLQSPFAMFYVWSTVFSFGYFASVGALAQWGLSAALYAGDTLLLTTGSFEHAATDWLTGVTTMLVVGLFIRRLQNARRATDALFVRAFADAQLGMCLVDSDLRVARVNELLCKMLGRAEGEMLGIRVGALGHAADAARLERALSHVLRDGTSTRLDQCLRRADGSELFIRGGAVLLHARGQLAPHVFLQLYDVTDEQVSAQDLRQSEERYRTVVESLHEGVLVQNRDGVVLTANRAAAEISGMNSQELIGSAPCITWPAIDENWKPIPAAERAPRVALRTGEVRGGIVGLTRPDGELRWLRINANPIEDGQGGVGSVVTTFADITEEREAGARARHMEEMYRSLVEGLPAVTYIADAGAHANWQYVSPQVESLLGVTVEELLARPGAWDELVHPDDVERVIAAEQVTIETGEPLLVEYRMCPPGGRTIYVQDRAEVLATDAGPRLQGVIFDITERRAAEASADRRARQQAVIARLSQQVVAGAPLDVLLEQAVSGARDALDVELVNVFEVQPGGQELLLRAGCGWTVGLVGLATVYADVECQAGYVLAQTDPVVVHELATETRFSPGVLLLNHGIASGISLKIPGPGGSFGILGVHSRSPRDFTADDLNFVRSLANAVAAAITRDHNEEIERQLAQMQRLETVGQLAGTVAHDFNNLLAVILGSVEFVLAEPELAKQAREDLMEVKSAAESAATLTRQLLMFARADVVDAQVLDLNAAIERTEGILRRAAGENVELALSLDASPAAARVDPSQLEQVLINLAVNARDAMPGGGMLRIATTTVEVPYPRQVTQGSLARGSYVEMTVEDTGTGISPDAAKRAFDPFFTTKGRGQGTGLGLATVLGIVTRAGGAIDVASTAGEGTTLSVYWPALAVDVAADVEDRPLVARASGERILVVEDEHAIRLVAARILTEAGYKVTTAASGAEALRAVEAEDPDVVLTDVVMPGIHGPELVDAIQRSHPEIGVLYMSGYAEEGLGDYGDSRFIAKPFTGEALLAKVQTLLGSPLAVRG